MFLKEIAINRRIPSILWLALALAPPLAARADTSAGVTANNISHVKLGASKAGVTALLGAPWRTVQYNDLERVENEIWEYRGHEASGPFRLHIEFDARGYVVLIKKIPETPS